MIFCLTLFLEKRTPFLILVPLSTIGNWEREFAIWGKEMTVLSYVGEAGSRKIIRENEFYVVNEGKHYAKFDVLLTSYESLMADSAMLKKIDWKLIIVDEGHRLKNNQCKLFSLLNNYCIDYKVLLTGTPIQNNLTELFNLMEFLEVDFKQIAAQVEEKGDKEALERLHALLKPHILRRMKTDLQVSLPPKAEVMVPVSLSHIQRMQYKDILAKNYSALSLGTKTSFNNVLIQLRKTCNHPYLFHGTEPDTESKEEEIKLLVEASGKLVLLDKLLAKLKERGHRVLIFSQFTMVLDILEDWLEYKEWKFERIDGDVPGKIRQDSIDRFNSKETSSFCFLLSTRASRLGINLASADTVIMYDSDYNPQNDIVTKFFFFFLEPHSLFS